MGIDAIIFDLYETLITEFSPDWKPECPSVAQRLGMSEEAFASGWRRVNGARMRGVVDHPEALRRFAASPASPRSTRISSTFSSTSAQP